MGVVISSTDRNQHQADAPPQPSPQLQRLTREFEQALERLESARAFAKSMHQSRLFAATVKLLKTSGGVSVLYRFAPHFDAAGVFVGGDWNHPHRLQPALVRGTLLSQEMDMALECLSELRMLAIACGDVTHPEVSVDQAQIFLEEVIARNLDFLFPEATEVTREHHFVVERIHHLFSFIVQHIGSNGIITALVEECERVMLQRPIMVHRVEDMLRVAAHALQTSPVNASEQAVYEHAGWMIEALQGPTPLSRQHPEPEGYRQALAELNAKHLAQEAHNLGHRMDKTGLVCPQHATLLQFVAEAAPELLPAALALSQVGRASLAEYESLICNIIQRAVTPGTARCIYGLSRLLNRGILFFPPVPSGLQHLMVLPIQPAIAEQLRMGSLQARPPDANALLLAGTLSVIGQPRGVDQGHNPTCQSARAISLWSQNDVGYLLELIARAACDGEVVMHFEGEALRSSELDPGLAEELHPELDPVSLLLTPHLDKIYMEMSRYTLDREEDGHKWINPEFHGWWVHRGFASLIDAATDGIQDLDGFVRCFYAAYHPEYNGGQELVYAQPCGVVSTDALGSFVGWHAVSIQRIALDPQNVWRVFFFNPNRDKGQDWGQGIVTSTCDHGELEGESSLPFAQFAARLYVFHYKSQELGHLDAVPVDIVDTIHAAVAASWGAHFDWFDEEQA